MFGSLYPRSKYSTSIRISYSTGRINPTAVCENELRLLFATATFSPLFSCTNIAQPVIGRSRPRLVQPENGVRFWCCKQNKFGCYGFTGGNAFVLQSSLGPRKSPALEGMRWDGNWEGLPFQTNLCYHR